MLCHNQYLTTFREVTPTYYQVLPLVEMMCSVEVLK